MPPCWVKGPSDDPGPYPGIAIAWEQQEDGWRVLVSYYLETDGALVQQWVSAELVTRVER